MSDLERPLSEMTDDEILKIVRGLRERRSRASVANVTKTTRGRQAVRVRPSGAVAQGPTPEELAIVAKALMEIQQAQAEAAANTKHELSPDSGT